MSSISGSTATGSSGNAGHIKLDTQQLTLKNGGQINSFSKGSGNAGSITITAKNISLIDGILASSATQGSGGDVELQVHNRLHISDSLIVTRTTGNSAGDITASTESFILDRSQLLANAVVGDGGNIDISAGQLTVSGNSWIDVSSKYGVNGQLILNSVKLRDDFLTLSPPGFRDIELSLSRCPPISVQGFSSFTVRSRDVLPTTPEDLR